MSKNIIEKIIYDKVSNSQLKTVLEELMFIIKESESKEQAIETLSNNFLLSYEQSTNIVNCRMENIEHLLRQIFEE